MTARDDGRDAVAVAERLARVDDTLFERLVLDARIERARIPPPLAPLATRAQGVAELATHDAALCRRLHHLLDEHAPWTRSDGGGAVTADADALARGWLEWGLERHGRVAIVGYRESEITIELDQVYVPLTVSPDRGRGGAGPGKGGGKGGRGGAGDGTEGLDGEGRALTFDDALARMMRAKRGLALVGDPGAGKSTLLRYLYRRVVLDAAEGPLALTGELAALRGLFPVLVRLSRVADSELVERGLEGIAARVAADDGYPGAWAAARARRERRYLFLLDGLDEVKDEATREAVCRWLEREVDHWRGSTFVVTSRRAAWTRSGALVPRFVRVEVQGLRGEQVEKYVRRWFDAVVHFHKGHVDPPEVVTAEATARAGALLAVVTAPAWRNTARLAELTANPLLLSTLCLVHHSDTRLPDKRGELYERTLGLLFEVWTRDRRAGPVLGLELTRLVLQPLAYAMMTADRTELSLAEATAILQPALARVPGLRPVAPTAARFIELVRDECGVFQSRDLDTVAFVHLSFQEYLAACHVSVKQLGAALADRLGESRWEEVTLLAMSRSGVFEPFMARALERADAELLFLRQCLRETLELAPEPFDAAAARHLAALTAGDRAAAPALRRLFELVAGHELPGVAAIAQQVLTAADRDLRASARTLLGLAPEVEPAAADTSERKSLVEPVTGMELVWIAGGSFLMGATTKKGKPGYDDEAYPDEGPPHRVTVSGFWMAVHPVTNKQYTAFLAATGREPPPSFAERHLTDERQPVVTVSWEDARAFTRWMTSQLTGDQAGQIVRLPTEAEWEYAARGAAGRRYPWGKEPPDRTRATFQGGGQSPDRPAPIGNTPAGATPEGVHDLAGNVLEWCLDAWADSYAGRPDGEPDPCHHGDTRGGPRVVRGGSWIDGPRGLRSAFRNWSRPQVQSEVLGFRVVCGGSPQPESH